MPRKDQIDWDRIDLSDEQEQELEDCYQAASKIQGYGHNSEQVIRDCMEDDLGFPRGFTFPRKARGRVDEQHPPRYYNREAYYQLLQQLEDLDLDDQTNKKINDCFNTNVNSRRYNNNRYELVKDCSKQAGVKLTTEDRARLLQIIKEELSDKEIEDLRVVHGDQLGLYLRAIIKDEFEKMQKELSNKETRTFKVPLKQLQAPADVTVPSNQKRKRTETPKQDQRRKL
jgi:hypothetical protein